MAFMYTRGCICGELTLSYHSHDTYSIYTTTLKGCKSNHYICEHMCPDRGVHCYRCDDRLESPHKNATDLNFKSIGKCSMNELLELQQRLTYLKDWCDYFSKESDINSHIKKLNDVKSMIIGF